MTNCSTGSVNCGSYGCRPTTACCVPFAGWACAKGHTCYTLLGTVHCVNPVSQALTAPHTCNDFGATCLNNECFTCSDKASKSCFPLIYISGSVVLRKTSCGLNSTAITSINTNTPDTTTTATSPAGEHSIVPSMTGPGPAPETSHPAPEQSSPPAAASGTSPGTIAGIVIGLCAVLVLAAILVVVLRRRKAAVPQEVQWPYVPELGGIALVRKEPARAELM